jgi:DNA polymerase III subunit alpha
MFSLHTHNGISNASRGFADSSIKIEDLIKKAKKIGLEGIAITDHESVGGFVSAKNLESQEDYPVICGNEIYLVSDEQYDILKDDYEKGMYYPHFLLLAMDKIGNKMLRELSTIAWTENGFHQRGLFRTPTKFSDIKKVIGSDKGHVVAGSACLGGQINKWILDVKNNPDNAEMRHEQITNFIEKCKNMFGEDNFFLELQPTDDIESDQHYANTILIKYAERTDTELVITTDVHYLEKDLLKLHAKFLNSDDDNDEDSGRNVEEIYKTAYLMSEEEVRDYFDKTEIDKDIVDRAIGNTNRIGKRAERYELKQAQKVPKIEYIENWEIEEGFFPNTGVFKRILNSNIIDDKYLLYRIQEGMKRNTQFIEYEETIERLEEELSEILEISEVLKERLGGYFITMEKLIDIIWSEGDSIVGVGRGSCGSSIIAFLLDIIQYNPLKSPVELPFWRFITKTRIELADIDIDTQNNRRQQIFHSIKKYFSDRGGDVVNCCTYGTVGSKSAIQTAGRGLGISSDVTQALSSMIPIERGAVWSLSDVYYGNEEEDRKPKKEFVNAVNKIEGLFELAQLIEGVIVSRGVHAAGLFITNSKFTEYNAKMMSPNGIVTSQWDLHQSEQNGLLKYDMLTTEATTKIRVAMDLLIEHGKIDRKETLKETYMSVLHPHVMNYNTPEVWGAIAENRVMDLFQFSTLIAMQTNERIKPHNIVELSQANSLMRLQKQPEADESPTDTYVRFKNNIKEWYREMDEYKVPKEDQEILKRVLMSYNGVAESQEVLMILSQIKEFSSFNIAESHKLRKSIAKKSKKVFKEITDLFYEKCKENEVNKNTARYIWEVQVLRQKQYSFSIIHSMLYSLISLQELVLFTQYPEIYWNTACLTVNSGSLDEEDSIEKKQSTNYGKIAIAIGKVQEYGGKVELPDINKSSFGFVPVEEDSSIIFGLKGIVGINDEIVHDIMSNRPYTSLEDFHNRLTLTKKSVTDSSGKEKSKSLIPSGKVVTLIKSGAFDNICGDRVKTMKDYINMIHPPKTKLNFQNFDSLIDLGLIPEELNSEVRMYKFYKFINKSKVIEKDAKTKSKKWFNINQNDSVNSMTEMFFEENFIDEMKEGQDYRYELDGTLSIFSGANSCRFDKLAKEKYNGLVEWLKSDECVNTYNDETFRSYWHKYTGGSDNLAKWEMSSVMFYYNPHELTHVDRKKYSISNYFELNDEPEVVRYNEWRGIKFPQYQTTRLCGTVLDKDKTKHIVSLLTNEGVVSLKYNSGSFIHYEKQISYLDEDGRKITIEDGWLKKGNLLLVSGYRKNGCFRIKKNKNDVWEHTTMLIEDIDENGSLKLKSERSKV